MKRVAIAAACVAMLVTVALAQQPAGTSGSMSSMSSGGVMILASEAKWSPAPPLLPSGSEITVLEGDPTQSGPFVMQLKMPDGYQIKPHWHPTDERLTIVQGTMSMGMGEKWSESDMKEMTPGSFSMLPARHPHYVQAKGTTIVQVESTGPFDLTYLNASDDPRKK